MTVLTLDAANHPKLRLRMAFLLLTLTAALAPCGCAAPAAQPRTVPGAGAAPRADNEAAEMAGRRATAGLPAIPNDRYREAFLHRWRAAAPHAAAATAAAAAAGSWTARGASNVAGRTQVTVVSSDGQSLLVGTAGGNIFGGSPQAGWQPRADSLNLGSSSYGVHLLLVTPGSPEVWLAAGYFNGIQVSTDGGASWSTPAGLPALGEIFRMVHDGGNPSTVYLLAEVSESQAQLFRSADGGQTFTGMATLPVTDTLFGIAGLDLWTSRTASGPLYVMLQRGQLLVSADQGATFSPLGAAGPGNSNMVVLGGSEAGSPTLYAMAGQTFQNWVLYASEDGGKTWAERYQVGTTFFSGNSGLGTSMSNPSLVLFGGIFAFRSTNGGRTFEKLPFDYTDHPETQLHIDIDGLQTAQWQGRETLFINTDGGGYMSTDGGATLQNITLQDFPDPQYYSVFTSPSNPYLMVVGAQDQGYQASIPGSPTLAFDQIFGGDCGGFASSTGDFKNVFVTTVGQLGFMPDPTKAATTGIFTAWPPFTSRAFFPAITADPADSTGVFAAGDHIWHVQHADQQYGQTQTQLPQDFSAGNGDYIASLAISPANPSYWYAITDHGVLWSSHDQGATWTSSAAAGAMFGTAVLPSASDPLTCYAGGIYGANGVYQTTDGGATWNALSNGLTSVAVEGLGFDGPATQNLYAATDDGPFAYDAAGGAWTSLLGAGNGAPLTRYMAVEGLPAAGIVRFATYGRGVWDYSPTGSSQPPPPPPPPPVPTVCTAGPNTLCLVGGRFQVQATWQNQFNDTDGQALAIPRTDESGFLGFTDPTNVELIVKILNLNGVYKVFYGELTDLHFTLTVSDTLTGTVKIYTNTPGDCGAIDEVGFPVGNALRAALAASGRSAPAASARVTAPAAMAAMTPRDAAAPLATLAQPAAVATGACRPGSGTLCLMNRRFALSMQWSNPGNATSGAGGAVPLTGDLTGAFFFTDSADLELVVKVLDLGDRIAVFYGTLSDLEYTLTVTDTRSGAVKSYHNAAGNYCGGLDNSAFTP
jgi:photosystem II stability/assembly factor-like uncharacterized protein